ncbi:MAG: helix-turn-helix domain-containing protein [Myxococcota bacterium]|nr:helix-turn-helix domain-containing protein [Myxococcota bacterium]
MAQRKSDPKARRRKPAARRSTAERPPLAAAALPAQGGLTLQDVLLRGLGALTTGVAGRMASSGVGLRVGRALLLSPEAARMRRDAGRTIRELRELAGLTVDELAEAIELSDRSLLGAVERGTATLSFELILRLSALLARNDPVPFVAKLTRSYNPALWKLFESWGIGRIPLHLERERRFLNVYRSHDLARDLSDDAFERVLDFTTAAFEMALGLAAAEEKLPRRRRPKARRPRP